MEDHRIGKRDHEALAALVARAREWVDHALSTDDLHVSIPKHQADALLRAIEAACLARAVPQCRACGKELQAPDSGIADGCPCNAPRGVNHGLVPTHVCTCKQCDPAQTGAARPQCPYDEQQCEWPRCSGVNPRCPSMPAGAVSDAARVGHHGRRRWVGLRASDIVTVEPVSKRELLAEAMDCLLLLPVECDCGRMVELRGVHASDCPADLVARAREALESLQKELGHA